MKLQTVLIGHLIELHPLQVKDFDLLFQSASDPLIWEQHPQKDRYKKEVFKKFFAEALGSKGAYVVHDRMTQTVIGTSRYYNYAPEKRQITIGYTFLRKDYWGHTYNREMKSLMLSYAFQFIDSVLFEIGENNLRSRKAIEKIGARLKGSESFDGSPHMIYELRKEEFKLLINGSR